MSRVASTALLAVVLASAATFAQEPSVAPSASRKPAPDSPSDVLSQADASLQAGKPDEAIAALNEYSLRRPGAKGIAHRLGVAYYAKGELGQAMPQLNAAIKEDPADREATQLLGLSYFALGRPAEAIPLLERVREWFPSAHLDASYYLGTAYLQTRRYADAEAAFADVYGVPKDSAASHLLMARMLLRQEFEPISEEYARKAIAADAKLPLAHFLLGEIYLYKSQIPEAIAELQKEIAINPGYAVSYTRLADAYIHNSQFDDAERVLSRSIYLDATASPPYILLGKVMQRKNDHQRAVAALERATRLDPNNYLAHYMLGQSLNALGRNTEAEVELRRAQELQNAANRLPAEKKRQ
jgi:tetratricopeptide (TPR) repeat protein